MAISVTCSCGRSLRAKDEAAGKRVRCPQCGSVVQVPAAELDDQAFDDLMSAPSEYEVQSAPPPPPPPSAQAPVMRPPPPPLQSAANWGAATVGAGAPAKNQRRGVVFEQGWFGNINSGALGGLLMMVIAVVWFVLGLMANRIFFYPPILFVIGLISLFKGLFGGGE
jgi:hypothetical protein